MKLVIISFIWLSFTAISIVPSFLVVFKTSAIRIPVLTTSPVVLGEITSASVVFFSAFSIPTFLIFEIFFSNIPGILLGKFCIIYWVSGVSISGL